MPPPAKKKARTEQGSVPTLAGKNKNNSAIKQAQQRKDEEDVFLSRPAKQQAAHAAKQAEKKQEHVATIMGGSSGKIKVVKSAGAAPESTAAKGGFVKQQGKPAPVAQEEEEEDEDCEEGDWSDDGAEGEGEADGEDEEEEDVDPLSAFTDADSSGHQSKNFVNQLIANSKKNQKRSHEEDSEGEEEEEDDVVDNDQDHINLCANRVEKDRRSAEAWFELSLAMVDGSAAAVMLSGKLTSLLQCHVKAVECAMAEEEQIRQRGLAAVADWQNTQNPAQQPGKKQLRRKQLLEEESAVALKKAGEATADAWCNLGASMTSSDSVTVAAHSSSPLSQVQVRAMAVEKLKGESSFAWNNLGYALVEEVLRPSANSNTRTSSSVPTAEVGGKKYTAVECCVEAIAALSSVLEDATGDEMAGPYDTLGVALSIQGAESRATVLKLVKPGTAAPASAGSTETLSATECLLRALNHDRHSLWAWYHLGFFVLKPLAEQVAPGAPQPTVTPFPDTGAKPFNEDQCYAEALTKQDEETQEEFFADLLQQEPVGADYIAELGLATKPTEFDREEHEIYMAKTLAEGAE